MGGASDGEEEIDEEEKEEQARRRGGKGLFRTTRAKFIRVDDDLRRGFGEACASGTGSPLCRGNLDDSVPGGGLRFGVVGYRGDKSGEA
ncbi:hypothetical protein V495_03505 [Pseudogymnoascus sp. VKM F-4514 (FW-929)]|nr:hypothetical protein V495_03505 [Pseudogymnoascus sp. VKM F-4514 (FW-929)]KFY52318.1 hypothetical protein V497_08552 [Pseudogymnoascus sp. VKM F-4516 (FW-969)]